MDAITLLERCYNTMSLAKSNIQEEQDLMDDITDFLNKEEISQEEKNKKIDEIVCKYPVLKELTGQPAELQVACIEECADWIKDYPLNKKI